MFKPVRSLAILLACAVLAACSQSQPPTAPLSVTEHFPAVDATDVPVDAVVAVAFDSDLDEASFFKPLLLTAEDGTVNGEVTYDANRRSLILFPESELNAETMYTVTVAETVRGISGGYLGDAVTWSFTTEAASTGGDDGGGDGDSETPGEPVGDDELPTEDEVPGGSDNPNLPPRDETEIVLPGVLSVSPMPWTRAERTTTVDITFEGDFADGALSNGVKIAVYPIWLGLFRAWGLDFGGIDGVLTEDGNVVTFRADKKFKNLRWYWVYQDIDVNDEHGNELHGSADWLFKTINN